VWRHEKRKNKEREIVSNNSMKILNFFRIPKNLFNLNANDVLI